MTDRAPRARATRSELRAWAWVAGGLALVAPWAAIAASPTSTGDGERPTVVVRRVTRRVIVTHPTQPAGVRSVAVGGGSSSPPAAPAPATTTGGS
ncbi:MAG TPA: hypothetical protein VFK59_10030 [Actinomycetota bacterium]|jgi:hypothetical protein|nr:hypothetical protein [Actinomycetota bacterium]